MNRVLNFLIIAVHSLVVDPITICIAILASKILSLYSLIGMALDRNENLLDKPIIKLSYLVEYTTLRFMSLFHANMNSKNDKS